MLYCSDDDLEEDEEEVTDDDDLSEDNNDSVECEMMSSDEEEEEEVEPAPAKIKFVKSKNCSVTYCGLQTYIISSMILTHCLKVANPCCMYQIDRQYVI